MFSVVYTLIPAASSSSDILPALFVTGTRRIGVRQLVQQEECGAPCERGVEVELLEPRAAILDGDAAA